jgi:hypothetical protein
MEIFLTSSSDESKLDYWAPSLLSLDLHVLYYNYCRFLAMAVGNIMEWYGKHF